MNTNIKAILAVLFMLFATPSTGCNRGQEPSKAAQPTESIQQSAPTRAEAPIDMSSPGAVAPEELKAEDAKQYPVPRADEVVFVKNEPFSITDKYYWSAKAEECGNRYCAIFVDSHREVQGLTVIIEQEPCLYKVVNVREKNGTIVDLNTEGAVADEVCEAWPYQGHQNVIMSAEIFPTDVEPDRKIEVRLKVHGMTLRLGSRTATELAKFTNLAWFVKPNDGMVAEATIGDDKEQCTLLMGDRFNRDTFQMDENSEEAKLESGLCKQLALSQSDPVEQGVLSLQFFAATINHSLSGKLYLLDGESALTDPNDVLELVRSLGRVLGHRVNWWYNTLNESDQKQALEQLTRYAARFTRLVHSNLVHQYLLDLTWDQIRAVRVRGKTPQSRWKEPWEDNPQFTRGQVYMISFWQRRGDVVFEAMKHAVEEEPARTSRARAKGQRPKAVTQEFRVVRRYYANHHPFLAVRGGGSTWVQYKNSSYAERVSFFFSFFLARLWATLKP